MRSLKKIHKAHYAPIADLITYSPLPSADLKMIDPFLFLNHHGPQKYKPNNNGLPFGPHPHRGMETVTFILDGDIMHKDSGGHESTITAGGVQWMTAGKGLIHAEVSSNDFKEKGGDLEILQLWLNLPKNRKMEEPFYKGLQKNDIPQIKLDDGNVTLNLIAGKWQDNETKAAFEPKTEIFLSTIFFEPNGIIEIKVPTDHNIFFYVIRGFVHVNNNRIDPLNLVEFENDDEKLKIEAETDVVILFGHTKPFNEAVVAQGPFVMNTEEEIQQAYVDYRQGKFGKWVG